MSLTIHKAKDITILNTNTDEIVSLKTDPSDFSDTALSELPYYSVFLGNTSTFEILGAHDFYETPTDKWGLYNIFFCGSQYEITVEEEVGVTGTTSTHPIPFGVTHYHEFVDINLGFAYTLPNGINQLTFHFLTGQNGIGKFFLVIDKPENISVSFEAFIPITARWLINGQYISTTKYFRLKIFKLGEMAQA